MAIFKAFKAVRPVAEMADKVAALPYDVMSSAEARVMVEGKPWSFLHVDRPEIDLDPSVYIYSDEVYARGKANLDKLLADGINMEEPVPVYYIYRQIMNGRAQAGIVGCASIDDYLESRIKKHEFTRPDKEEDRIRHVDTCNANTGPIFLTFRDDGRVSAFTASFMAENEPLCDFVAEDGIRHTVWRIADPATVEAVRSMVENAGDFYIADGHHRSASAVKVGLKRRAEHPDYDGTEEFNFFLAVLFPSQELKILDYNRVVKDLNGLEEAAFLEAVSANFVITAQGAVAEADGSVTEAALEAVRPPEKHTFEMYLGGKWYLLRAKEGTFDEADPVDRLDVSILQNKLLAPVLGIGDPRTDVRISFVGGIRGLKELVKRVDGGEAVAFAMYPTTLDDLMAIADAGLVMPPKSTWFEPKLRSGLFIHYLS